MSVLDDGIEEAFVGFGEDEAPQDPPVETPKDEEKPEEPDTPEEAPDKPEEDVTPAEDEEKPTDKPEEAAEAPAAPTPLTKQDVESVVSNLLSTERSAARELEATVAEVMDKYYPEGLSNTLIDERSGKELRTPQDVVDASGGTMSPEEAAQWIMNEQFKLNQEIEKIKTNARTIAETTVNFRRDAITAVQKYEPLFKWQPQLQQKIYDFMMKQVKVDKDKDVILSAPDVMDLYDTYLEPYQRAYEFNQNKPATNPVASDPETAPEPPKPTTDDRLDISGDGGPGEVDDPNDFAQQVSKELGKGL